MADGPEQQKHLNAHHVKKNKYAIAELTDEKTKRHVNTNDAHRLTHGQRTAKFGRYHLSKRRDARLRSIPGLLPFPPLMPIVNHTMRSVHVSKRHGDVACRHGCHVRCQVDEMGLMLPNATLS